MSEQNQPDQNPPINFMVTSLYGYQSRRALVHLAIDAVDWDVMMSPQDARSLAANLLVAADASEGDAFLVDFAKKEIGVDDQGAAILLRQFRQWRDGQEGGRNLPRFVAVWRIEE